MATAAQADVGRPILVAVSKVKDGSFNTKAVTAFRTGIQAQLSVAVASHDELMSSFSNQVCAELKRLFILEGCEHAVPGLRFFYTALLLTDDGTEVLFPVDPVNGELLVADEVEEVQRALWKSVYTPTYLTALNYQKVLDLFEEMATCCERFYGQKPCVCYLISLHVFKGYAKLKLPKQQFINLSRGLVLLMAKCALIKERFDIAEKKGQEAAELFFDGKNAEAFEVWSEACRKQENTTKAVKLGLKARQCALQHEQTPKTSQRHKDSDEIYSRHQQDQQKDETNEIRQQLLSGISATEHNSTDTKPCRSQTKVPSGDAVRGMQQLKQESKKSEINEEKGLSEEEEDDDSYIGTVISDSSEYEEEGESSLSDTDSINHEEPKTWFDESDERYQSGEFPEDIVAGEGMDIVHKPKHDYKHRMLKYESFFDKARLHNLLTTDPNKYKRCLISLDGPHFAICKVLEEGHTHEEIEIHGRGKCGQTFNGDEVVVEVLAEGEGLDVGKMYGTVIGVLHSNFRETDYPVLACTPNPREIEVMQPTCKSVPKIYIWNHFSKTHHKDHRYRIDVYKLGNNRMLAFDRYFDILPGKKEQYVFLVVYISWDPHFNYPKGAVVKILDCGQNFKSGLKILENQFRVPNYYKKETVTLVKQLMNVPDVRSVDEHQDFRQLCVFTVDPPEAKDLDDALSVWKHEENLIVGVHITDVTSLVKKGDALDQEAQIRSTSFFASTKKKYHMLPEPLSEDRLSLLEGVDRFALSILFTMDKTGNFAGSPSVNRSIIRSCKKLSYQDAQQIINGNQVKFSCSQTLKSSIRTLHILAKHLRKQRLKNSRFSSSFQDPRFINMEHKQETPDAQALVEEFMIKANNYIASWLMESFNGCVLLRSQRAPPREKVQKWKTEEGNITDMLVRLQDRCVFTDTTCDVSKQCRINYNERIQCVHIQKYVWEGIQIAVDTNDFTDTKRLLCCDNMHPLQCLATDHWVSIQEPAEYRCSSESSEIDLLHYSLNIFPYTQFTSPLRRYVDLVVHRLVHALLDSQETSPYTQNELKTLSRALTASCKREKGFSRSCRIVRKSEKLANTPFTFNVVVSSVNGKGAKLCIPSLNDISEQSKILPFNLLDCCRKPEVSSGEDEVICYWNKRLYRHKDRHLRDREEHDAVDFIEPTFVHLDSSIHMECIPFHEYARILKTFFKRANTKDKSLTNISVPHGNDICYNRNSGAQRLTSEGCGDVKINHHCKFSLKFSRGQVLKIQMHAIPDRGMLTPYVQLFHVCENLSLCLTHLHDPVETFAKYVTKSIRYRTFESVEEYQKTWLPIVAMETATSSVGSEETIVIDNVKVTLSKSRIGILGKIELDAKFCDFRQIEVGGKTIDRLEKMGTKESAFEKCSYYGSLDYLCLRYTPPEFDFYSTFSPESVWVGHALIKKVKQRPISAKRKKSDPYGGAVVITFQLRTNSIKPPDHLYEDSFIAVAEIMVKSEVDRRTEQMLEGINKEGTHLAKSIALSRLESRVQNKGAAHFAKRVAFAETILPIESSATESAEEETVRALANNESQIKAIRNALVKPFSLIQGPPGTGKTSTGLKLVYLFNRINKMMHDDGYDKDKRQVLFCGPSNKSVDLVARYLMMKLGEFCPRILRMYGKTIENLDYPVPKRDIISNRSLRGLKSDVSISDITVHRIIRRRGTYAAEIRNFDEMFKNYNSKPEENEVTLDAVKTYNRLVARAEQEELKKCDVILCTCAVAGSKKLTEVSRISQCIIDESAMCPEPQSMIPIIAAKPDQVVLIGDHRQLRPIVKCTQAAELGLDQSLFERYKKDAAFLNTQYRMHERICEFPAREFYAGKDLRTGPNRPEDAKWYIPPGRELSIWPVRTNPKVFCHVEGVEETLTVSTEEGNEQSKSNKLEVEKVVDAFLYLVVKEEVGVKEINLMTQYNAQRHLIKETLKDRLQGRHISPELRELADQQDDLTVQTVVASQGGEWDYVIFSTVRSLPKYKIETHPTRGWCQHNLGFITDDNQINVALTRARKGLIIIGNAHLLECDKVWNKLLKTYKSEKCFVDAAKFPHRTIPGQPE